MTRGFVLSAKADPNPRTKTKVSRDANHRRADRVGHSHKVLTVWLSPSGGGCWLPPEGQQCVPRGPGPGRTHRPVRAVGRAGRRGRGRCEPLGASGRGGLDEAVLDFHDAHEIHLLTVGGRAWVFPHHASPVGEEPAVVLAQRRRALRHLGQERTQLVQS